MLNTPPLLQVEQTVLRGRRIDAVFDGGEDALDRVTGLQGSTASGVRRERTGCGHCCQSAAGTQAAGGPFSIVVS